MNLVDQAGFCREAETGFVCTELYIPDRKQLQELPQAGAGGAVGVEDVEGEENVGDVMVADVLRDVAAVVAEVYDVDFLKTVEEVAG